MTIFTTRLLQQCRRSGVLLLACGALSTTATAGTLSGVVVDINGNPRPNVQVIYTRADNAVGASVVTVFSDDDGSFDFPDAFPERITTEADIRARGLGLQQLDRVMRIDGGNAHATFVVRTSANQAETAPAAAWLSQRIPDRAEQAAFIMNCIDCHQVPASEVRQYAAAIDDLHAPNPETARRQSWDGMVKYMNFLSAWEFSRGGRPDGAELDTDAVYAVENSSAVVDVLTSRFDDRMDHIDGYEWGAPVISTPATSIREYAVAEPNNIREAVMLGDPARLLAADVGANRIVGIDVRTGEQRDYEVPTDYPIGPHSLHRGPDGTLWVTPLFNNTVARLDPATGAWRTWRLTTASGGVGIHDLSFSADHELATDARGRVWFSDIGNRAVGYFDPSDGSTQIWNTPVAESRAGDSALYGSASVYGLVMTNDGREVWYSQLGNGVFGGFDIETEEFIGPFVLPSANAGPRRISISEDDIMYMALYGTGQIAEFDINKREMIAIHDLPDTASAPYAVTWDPVRRVVWAAVANNDVIYRFDPATREFGVLPLPREQTFLRMIDIDPATGVLVTSTANIVEVVNGPRMAMIIDPGDGAYPAAFSPANATAPHPAD